MKQIKNSEPKKLLGTIFSIPLFHANSQEYKCIEIIKVIEPTPLSGHKKYELHFDWVSSSYSVPEKLKMIFTFNDTHGIVSVSLNEKRTNGNYIPLYDKSFDAYRVASADNIQKMIYDLIQD